MKVYDVFKEYIWLINVIHRAKGITLAELSEEWQKTEMSGGLPLSRRTFIRHRNAIEDMFGLDIEVGRGHKYYIENSHVLEEDTVQNWLLSTLSMNNIISESLSVQDRIFLESIPEVRHLELLVEAMKDNHKVRITHKKYGSTETTERVIEPYFLKLHKRRWYVMANTEHGYRTFSFDRITKAEVLDETFEMPEGFDPKAYFADTFGVMKDERKPVQRIVLRAFGNEKHYIEDLPIHYTQQKIGKGDGYVDYEITMRPTSDFIGHVLSRGAWLKVILPQEVADEVKNSLLKSLEMYK